LSGAARQLLTWAAVVGRRFDFVLLQQIAGRDEHEFLALVKELITAQLVVEETAERFAFRHALTRQAVYAELLGRERQALHRVVAETLEALDAGALDPSPKAGTAAQAADLAYHFFCAGEWSKTLAYAQRAGQEAQRGYAPRAAVEHFTRALEAAQHLNQALPLMPLYRGRGRAYEILGEFEQARANLETALAHARALEDRPAAWQAQMDLGALWAARDYVQTGGYLRDALELARTLDDPLTLARSLNRMGNWYVNIGQPDEAPPYHQEALVIFQTLNDRRGLAQTYDLMGIASLLGGDAVQGAAYLQQAVTLFRALDDRQGLASSLATLSICGVNYSTELAVPAAIGLAESINWCERAVALAGEIGWRAGEALALLLSSYSLGAYGQYGQALEKAQRGLEIAQEIGHRQWMSLAHRALAYLYLDLLAQPAARSHLEHSKALANEVGSLYHARVATGHLILLLIGEHEHARAQALLDAALTSDLPMQANAQRWLWRAHAELALSQGNPALALQIADRLITSAANMENRAASAIPHLAHLRGRALAALQRWPEAEAVLLAAQATAQTQAIPRLLWRIHVDLGHLCQAQGRYREATDAFAAAQQTVEEIAGDLPDPALRDNFLRQAATLIPQPQSDARSVVKVQEAKKPSPSAEQYPAGLTTREVEVLRLVAQGATNRQIAATLHISDRTVNTHLSNILNKTGCENRTAAAAFALQTGLV
jgi:DNA-binding CsgD family transcriptional regulator